MDVMQKAFYGGVVPAALAISLAGLSWWRARRGRPCWRLAAWAGPLAAGAAMAISFVAQFAGFDGRWRWIVPAALTLLLMWPALLSLLPSSPFTERRWTSAILIAALAAALLSACAGLLMWPTFYEKQEMWLRAVPLAAVILLGSFFCPLALGRPTPADGMAIAAAGALLTPVIVFSGNAMLGELLLATAIAAGTASSLALAMRGERLDEWRGGISAGAIGVGLVYPQFALLAWGNSYGLPASHAWALTLPCVAPLLVWVARLPPLARRPVIAGTLTIALVSAVAAIGFVIALVAADTAAYDPGF